VNGRTEDLVREIDKALGKGSAADTEILLKFFKPIPGEEVRFRGVRAPELKRIAQSIYPRVKQWPVGERDKLCEGLWRFGDFEGGAIVCYLYRRFQKQMGAREFRLFTRWVDEYVNNWGLTDGVSLWLLGGAIQNDPALVKKLLPWTRAKKRWKRRAAAVSLVYPAKRGEHTTAIFQIADALLGDADDMVQKGVGWLLKETYPKHPREVMEFLMPRCEETTRLVLRYAAEKMNARDRARLLG
jgi:3-methyladenine DNA glycosylase AlkD